MSILEDRRLEERYEERPVQESLVVFERHPAVKQRRQMLMALGILCVALLLVVVKDWNFWFPAETTAQAVPATGTKSPSASAQLKVDVIEPVIATRPRGKSKVSPPPVASVPEKPMPEAAGPSIIATQRRALPPLEVEVIAGDSHRTLQAKNNSMKVDLHPAPMQAPATPASSTTIEAKFQPAVEAPASVHMSPQTTQVVESPVEPNYPLLAKQMKVQGAVVLQALIGRAGNIEDLHVLSGPAILSSAAMEAVKQWRFKPYLQSGRPVDTEARITVNFTISTF
jgi:TonB family protein